MSRRMSCAITVDAVRARTKTETRRHVGSWRTLSLWTTPSLFGGAAS